MSLTFKRAILRILGGSWFVLLYGVTLSAQTIIEGRIIASENEAPIVSAQVIAYSADGKEILVSAITDETGWYQLTVVGHQEVALAASALFYTTEVRRLSLREKKRLEDIALVAKAFELDEVAIKAKRPILIKEDTVIYDAEYYARGDEVVAEDLLRSIPGVAVSADGTISVKGREVEKVMIDGDDFFEKGYRTLTKSLRAALIKEVELLDHYSNMSLLKGFEHSNKVALNLRLKPAAKWQTFGDLLMEGDAANPGDFLGQVDLINLNGKAKYYSLITANNLGNPPLEKLDNLWRSSVTTDNSLVDYSPQIVPLVSVRTPQPDFRFNRTVANEAIAGSLSSIIHLNDKVTLRPLIAGVSEDQFAGIQQFESLRLNEAIAIDNFRQSQTTNQERQLMGRVDLYADLNERTQLTSRTALRFGEEDLRNKLIINTQNSDEGLEQKTSSINQRLTYLQKINSKMAWLMTAYGGWEALPQFYSISEHPFLPLLRGSNDMISLHQANRATRQHLQVESHLFFRKVGSKGSGGELVFGTKTERLEMFHDLSASWERGLPAEIGSSSKLSVLNRRQHYLVGSLKDKRGKFSYQLKGGGHFFDNRGAAALRDPPVEKRFLLLPALQLEYQLGKKETVAFHAAQSVSNPGLTEVLPFAYVSSNGGINAGNSDFRQLLHSQASLLHTHGSFSDRFTLHNILSFRYDHAYISGTTTIYDNFIFQQALRLPGRQVWQASSSASQYFPGWRNSLKITASYSTTSFADQIEQFPTQRTLTARTAAGGLELRSAFRGMFNYHLGVTRTVSSVVGVAGSTYGERRFFADFSHRASARLKAGLVLESYAFSNERTPPAKLWLLDGSCSYDLTPKKVQITLLFRNLFNQTVFQTIQNSPLLTTTRRFELLPRSVRVGMRVLL